MIPQSIWTVAVGVAVLLGLAVMQWFGKFPASESVRQGIDMLNSRGGNILILGAMSIYFFAHSAKLFYYTLAQVQAGTLQENNAFALMALQFMTSSAFGGAFGALLKTMTADSGSSRASDHPAPTTTSAPSVPSAPDAPVTDVGTVNTPPTGFP